MTTNQTTQEFASDQARKKFAATFAEHGMSIYDYQVLDYNLQGLFEVPQRTSYLMLREFARKTVGDAVVQRCVVDFVDSDEIQAYATSQGEYHFIGVAHALPVLMQVLFQQLVRETNPFDYTRDDKSAGFELPMSLRTPTLANKSPESLLLGTIPDERWKKIMSVRLAEVAVLFCFCHEISHIVYGHTAMSAKRGLWCIIEGEEEPDTVARKVSASLSQAWELQADRNALALVLGFVCNDERFKTSLAKALRCNPREPVEEQLLARVVYSVSFVFFLFGQRQESEMSVGEHPSALTRQTFIMAEMVLLYSKRYPDRNADEFEEVVRTAALHAERAWRRLGFYSRKPTASELVPVVKKLSRYEALSNRYLHRYQWAYSM